MTSVPAIEGGSFSKKDLAGKVSRLQDNTSIRSGKSSDSLDASLLTFTRSLSAHYLSSSVSIVDEDDEDSLGSWDENQFGVLRKSISLGTFDPPKPVTTVSVHNTGEQNLRPSSALTSSSDFDIEDINQPKLWSESEISPFVPADAPNMIGSSMSDEVSEESDDELDFTSSSLPSPSFLGYTRAQRSPTAPSDNLSNLTEMVPLNGLKENLKESELNISSDDRAGDDERIVTAEECISVQYSNPRPVSSPPKSLERLHKLCYSPETARDEPSSSSSTVPIIADDDMIPHLSSTSRSSARDRSTPSLTADLSSSFFSSPSLADIIDPDSPLAGVDHQLYTSPSKLSPSTRFSTNVKEGDTVPFISQPFPTVSTVRDSESEYDSDPETTTDVRANNESGQSSRFPSPPTSLRSSLGNRSRKSFPYPKKPEPSIDSIFGAPKSDGSIFCATDNSFSRMQWMARTVPRAPRWSKRRKMTFEDAENDSPTARKHRFTKDQLVNLELDFAAWQKKFRQEIQDTEPTLPRRTDLEKISSGSTVHLTSHHVASPITKFTSYSSPQLKRPRSRTCSQPSASPNYFSSPLAQALLTKERRSIQAADSAKRGLLDFHSEQDGLTEVVKFESSLEEEEEDEEEEQALGSNSLPLPPPSPSPSCTPPPRLVNVPSLTSLPGTPCENKLVPQNTSASQSSINLVDDQTDDQDPEDEDVPLLKRPFTCAYTRSVSPDTSWMKQRQLSVDVPDDEDPLACVDAW